MRTSDDEIRKIILGVMMAHGVDSPEFRENQELLEIGRCNLEFMLKDHLKYDAYVTRGLSEFLENLSSDGNRENYQRALVMKRDCANILSQLFALIDKAETKPLFAPFRTRDWVNFSDTFMLLLPAEDEGILPEYAGTFVAGKMTKFYNDTKWVDMCLDAKVNEEKHLDGRGMSFRLDAPGAIKDWEYDYLRQNPEFLEIWIQIAKSESRDKTLDPKAFTKAILA